MVLVVSHFCHCWRGDLGSLSSECEPGLTSSPYVYTHHPSTLALFPFYLTGLTSFSPFHHHHCEIIHTDINQWCDRNVQYQTTYGHWTEKAKDQVIMRIYCIIATVSNASPPPLFFSLQVALSNGCPVPAVLLANKSDQRRHGLCPKLPKLEHFSQEYGFVGWFETSAKVGHPYTRSTTTQCFTLSAVSFCI